MQGKDLANDSQTKDSELAPSIRGRIRHGDKGLQNSIKIGLNERGSGWILAGEANDL